VKRALEVREKHFPGHSLSGFLGMRVVNPESHSLRATGDPDSLGPVAASVKLGRRVEVVAGEAVTERPYLLVHFNVSATADDLPVKRAAYGYPSQQWLPSTYTGTGTTVVEWPPCDGDEGR
jgi:hypothetical protein